jgi:hypothetical protein
MVCILSRCAIMAWATLQETEEKYLTRKLLNEAISWNVLVFSTTLRDFGVDGLQMLSWIELNYEI